MSSILRVTRSRFVSLAVFVSACGVFVVAGKTAAQPAGGLTQRACYLVQADPSEATADGFSEPESFVYYRIRNRHSGKRAAVSGGHVHNGASVIQWADEDQRDVFWRAIPARERTYKLKNRNSGRFLAASGGRRDNGQNVIQWDDNYSG